MPRDILELPAPSPDRRIPYGPDPFHFGDLRLPSGPPPYPAIVYIHGGFWRSRFSLEHAGHVCAALQSIGIATWNLEYRRVGQPGGGFPGTLDDVLLGARFIREIAASQPIDLERIAVAGHSAGGHLALWVAAQSRTPLRRAVSLAGVTDLRLAFELNLGDGAAREFLGATPAEAPDRYTACSPIELLPLPVPQLLVHGTRDETVPIELSERFAARSNTSDFTTHEPRTTNYEPRPTTYEPRTTTYEPRTTNYAPCELFRIPGADHFDVIDPRSPFWPLVMSKLAVSVGGDT